MLEIFEKSIASLRYYKYTTLSCVIVLIAAYLFQHQVSNLDTSSLTPESIISDSISKWPDWKLGGNKDLWGDNVQDVMCSSLMSNMCFLVVDYEDNSVYSRTIMVNTLVGARISIADLIKPENDEFTIQNSAHWSINYYRLHKPYLRAMSISPYITGTIRKESQKPSILLIGVAGATLNNFYHEMLQEPVITGVELDATMVDVAEKWFGVKKSDRHRILVEDGVKFFVDRPETSEKYDAIFIDACQTDHDDELHCPIYEFRIEEMAGHVAKSLAENGTLAINVLSLNNTISAYDKILSVYKQHFSKCFFLDAKNGDWTNRVLVATNNPDLKIDPQEFVQRLQENMDPKYMKWNDFKVEIIE